MSADYKPSARVMALALASNGLPIADRVTETGVVVIVFSDGRKLTFDVEVSEVKEVLEVPDGSYVVEPTVSKSKSRKKGVTQ
jgi:hypothetical protein